MNLRTFLRMVLWLNCGLTMADFVDDLLDPARYDNRVRPGVDSGQPVTVFLDMYVNSISSIDEVQMEYTINIFMRQRWIDERLNFTQFEEDITLNYNLFDRLWVPDLFVKNEKKATFHDITVPNRLLKLSPNGQVYYSQRLSLTLFCDMNLKYYPMDNQTCKIELESYGYTTRDIVFKWRDTGEPVQRKSGMELPEFNLTGIETADCTTEYITGSFTCLLASLKLQRQFQYYLIQVFVPSCMIVALSWVSFWIDIYAVPARVTLGLLTVLTMTTQSSGISARLPRVSYIKAIDVWMTCCLIFVIGALIEYSIVNVLARSPTEKRKETDENRERSYKDDVSEMWAKQVTTENQNVIDDGITSNGNARSRKPEAVCKVSDITRIYGLEIEEAKKANTSCYNRMRESPALAVDMVSRIMFPAVFVIFNIIYWIIYKINADVSPTS